MTGYMTQSITGLTTLSCPVSRSFLMTTSKPKPKSKYRKWKDENKDKSNYYQFKFSYPPSD